MRYEYKTIPVDDGPLKDEALNRLGAEGWRLVSLVTSVITRMGMQGILFTYVFIREKR